jgi:hypothetical protein
MCMSKLLPFSTIKKYFCINLVVLATLCICMSHAYSQAVSISPASGGLSTSPLTGGSTDQAIFGVQLTKDAVAANTVTAISFGLSSNPAGKFSNPRLYESTDATFSGVGTETLIASGTLSATNVSFSGAPLTNFDGAGAAADNEFFFVVVDVDAAATGTITPSLASSGVTVSTSSVSGSTITGPAFDFLTADFTQNADDPSAVAGDNGVTLLDFTVNSNGTQSLNSTLTFTFDTDVTNILENFDFQVGGATIGGVVTYPLTGGGSILTVTGFNSEDVTNPTTFTLLADIKAGATSGDDFIISLASSGVTISPGIPEAFAPFTNSVDVTGLEADFTQNADDATAFADQNGITLLGFTVNSNGTQSLNSTLTFTFDTDVTNILENFDFQVGGSTIGGVVTYPLTGGGTILTVTGFTSEDVTNATNFTLLADIKAGVTSGDDFTISLASSGVNISPGIPEAFAPFTNSIDVTGLEADFTQNADDATALADQNRVKLLDFTVNSNGTQTLSSLVFTFNKDITNILENGDLEVDGVDVSGASIIISGGGTIATISFTGIDVTNDRVFRLFADIQASATTTDDFTITLVPGGVNIAPGTAEAFGTFSNSIDIVTSQLSDILLTSPTTTLIPYRNRQGATVHNTDFNLSTRIASYQLRDGGAVNDPDNKGTNMTSLTISVTNSQYIRAIALFDDDTDTEIAGTEQSINGAIVTTITFTPSSPISTTDNTNRNLIVRATFMDVVVDNAQIQLAITGVVATAAGSGFSPVAGWVSTTTAPGDNLIDVVATKLVFSPALPATVNVNTNFSVFVKAFDGLNNLDTDQNDRISLTESGPGNLTSFGGTTLTPFLSGGQFQWTDLRLSQSGSYPMLASDDSYDDDMGGDATGNITINSPACTITQPADPALCYGNASSAEVLGNIVITETDPAGFSGASGTYTFSLALPSGFIFDQSVTTGLALSGGDINTPSAYSYPSANVVQFSFDLNGTSTSGNSITIGGLKVQAPHPGTDSPPGTGSLTITRLGGSATIAGVGPGTTLGTISSTQQNPALTIEVDELSGNPAVDPNTTTFNVSSVAVKLITNPGSAQAQSVFTGSGVTSNPEYRFNPNSLAPGNYPVTVTHTNPANGCQSYNVKTFEVIISGIVGLNPSYCSNDLPATGLTVNQAYIDQLMQYYTYPTEWVLDKFVYYDYNVGWRDITTPINNTFDPALDDYDIQLAYWGGQIPIGFSVYNTNALAGRPAGSNYVVTYQWVRVNPAPTVSLSIPKIAFCMGDATVDLISFPQNSDNNNVDYFLIDGATDTRLTHVGTNPKVWKFTAGPTGSSGPVGSFDLTYSYLDPATSCRGTSSPVTITVNEVVPNITFPSNICAGDPVDISNTTTLRAASTTIINAGWDFGDQVVVPLGPYASAIPTGAAERTFGTYQNPSHLYQNNGTFQIFATIETSDGCVYNTPSQPVSINALPVANFTWTNACLGTATSFNATQNLPDAQIQSWNWDFSINNNLTTATDNGTNKNTSYNYPSIGKDTVSLIVTTNNLCRDTVYKPMFVVPTYTAITETNSYTNDFSTTDGWIAGGRNLSWALGTPNGVTIIGDASLATTGFAWDTNLTGSNNQNENSFVLSGCFDFSASTKPVISLDVWSDVPEGIDGAVLQVNVTGNIEELVSPSNPDGDWFTVGKVDEGINWYDDQGIVSNPGNQTSTSTGWTGKYGGWKKAIFKLDTLIGQTNVLMRIAFASSSPRGDGFAFDNIFVGERSRSVLLENFTNANIAPPIGPNTGLHNFANYTNIGTAGEVVKIQYHTAFPVDDPINDLNQQMNNARTAFYGVTESPTIRIDGRFNTGNISLWRDDLYDERVLTPSPIKLSVSAVKDGSVVKINTTIENTTTENISIAGINVFTTIVKKIVIDPALLGISGNSQFEYVASQMLPSPAGINLRNEISSGEILAGATFNVPEVIWENPNGDAIVVFVQSTGGNKKDVHQAFLLNTPPTPDAVTSTEDPQYAEKVHFYPNPANREVNIELPAAVVRETAVSLLDAHGRAVVHSTFGAGERRKTISTADLAGGVYLIQLSDPSGGLIRKKVMVVHQ